MSPSRGCLLLVLAPCLILGQLAWAEPPAVDLHGDPLPAGAITRLGNVRFLHAGPVQSVTFLSDGKTLVSAGDGRALHVWDAATGRELRRLSGHEADVRRLALSADGKVLVSGDHNGKVLVWNPATGERRSDHSWPNHPTYTLALAPDGQTLAAVDTSKATRLGGIFPVKSDAVIRLWDVAAGKEVRALEVPSNEVRALAFSPDGKVLASAGDDKSVRLWDTAGGKELLRINTPDQLSSALAFAPDGKSVVAGGDAIRLWDTATGKKLFEIRNAEVAYTQAAVFSPDGKTLATGHHDGRIFLWDSAAGKDLGRLQGGWHSVEALTFAADGKVLASGEHENGRVHLWDVAAGKERLPFGGHRNLLNAVAFSPDGKVLASGGWDPELRLWDWATGKELRCCPGRWGGASLCFAPDGKTLLSDGGGEPTQFQLWDPATGKLRTEFGEKYHPIKAATFTPDGRRVVSGNLGGSVSLWDPVSGKELRRFGNEHGADHSPIAVTPDGKVVTQGSEDQALGLWDLETGRELCRFQVDRVPSEPVAVSPDGRLLAVVCAGSPIRFWDLVTGKEVTPLEKESWHTHALAFSPDGLLLASAEYDGVHLWEVASRKELRKFRGHRGHPYALAFAPDGRVLASGGWDGTVLVWDVTGMRKDGRLPAAVLKPGELDSLWQDLLSDDALQAHQAVWRLTAAAPQAVPFLRERLRPVPTADPKRIARLVADLDHDDFQLRERATEELAELGEAAEEALRKALQDEPSAEVRSRAGPLLKALGELVPSPERLRGLRSLAVLEQAGTDEAQQVLAALVKGAAEVPRTRAAKAALERLTRRNAASGQTPGTPRPPG